MKQIIFIVSFLMLSALPARAAIVIEQTDPVMTDAFKLHGFWGQVDGIRAAANPVHLFSFDITPSKDGYVRRSHSGSVDNFNYAVKAGVTYHFEPNVKITNERGFVWSWIQVHNHATYGATTPFTISNVTYDVGPMTALPEPSTWLSMIIGFGVIGIALRRQRASLPLLGARI